MTKSQLTETKPFRVTFETLFAIDLIPSLYPFPFAKKGRCVSAQNHRVVPPIEREKEYLIHNSGKTKNYHNQLVFCLLPINSPFFIIEVNYHLCSGCVCFPFISRLRLRDARYIL